MEVAKGLWELVDHREKMSEMGKEKECLEVDICQSKLSFQQIVDVETLLCVAAILIKHSDDSNHAKAQLKCAQLLLESIPSCIALELKCRACSMLSQCYNLAGDTVSQKQVLNKGLELTTHSVDRSTGRLWFCNFNSQLANALIIEGDYQGSITALEQGYMCAQDMCDPELQMFFASSVLHVRLMQWDDPSLAEEAFKSFDIVWKSLEHEKIQQCTGLMFYKDLLHVIYLLRMKNDEIAAPIAKRLDSAIKYYIEKTGQVSANKDSLKPAYFVDSSQACNNKLELAPPPIDGQWLPNRAVLALLGLVAMVFCRPKRPLKDCEESMQTIREEFAKLGIDDGAKESDLQVSTIWMADVYLTHIMEFLENKVVGDLTRSEVSEAQLGLLQMGNWNVCFQTILEACKCTVKRLRGQYAHSKVFDDDDMMGVDLAERLAWLEASSHTSTFAVRRNDDVAFGCDTRAVSRFYGRVLEEVVIKTYTLVKDVFVLGSGHYPSLFKVIDAMRAVAKQKTFQDVVGFAHDMARLAQKAKLFGEKQCGLVVVGRSDIHSAAKIYRVACRKNNDKAMEYAVYVSGETDQGPGEKSALGLSQSELGSMYELSGSGGKFMENYLNWEHIVDHLTTLRGNKNPDKDDESLMEFVRDAIGEARRWDYYTDGPLFIVELRRGQKAKYRTAKPIDKGNPFSGYGELEKTKKRPVYLEEDEKEEKKKRKRG